MDSPRSLSLAALSSQATERPPVALFTWGFDYTWQVAGLQPWQLAMGGSDTWHRAHMALVERHRPDMIFYDGAGHGPLEPTLLWEDNERWHVREENSGGEWAILKQSLAVVDPRTGGKGCDPAPGLDTREAIDAMIPGDSGWGHVYLEGLQRLIDEVGEETLVLPHHSPGYICAAYAFGFERSMEAMLTDPELFVYTCDRFAQSDRRKMGELAEAGAEAVFIADSWASCDVLSPPMVERFALPYQASLIAAAQEFGLKAIMWNEGNILPILAQEAAIPMDAFAFEQPRKGVDITVAKVREVFGPKRCLFGNLDSELLLLRNDADEIAAAVREQIRQSGEGAPFVLCCGSPLPSNVTLTAVDAVMAAAGV